MTNEVENETRELLEYLMDYFQAHSDAPHGDKKNLANAILEGALDEAARELRLRGLLEMSLTGHPKGMKELCQPRSFNYTGMANALENAAGIALMAQSLHDKLNTPEPIATGSEGVVIQ